MDRRIKLHNSLKTVLGSNNVYFQPPETLKMNYPAIVYYRSAIDRVDADNQDYLIDKAYTVVVIDPNPDSIIVDAVARLPKCRWLSHNVVDNLNQDTFKIYS